MTLSNIITFDLLSYYDGKLKNWLSNSYQTKYTINHHSGTYVAGESIYQNKIVLQSNETTLVPVSNNSLTLTTSKFNPFGKIFFYSGNTTSSTVDSDKLYSQGKVNIQTSFNATLVANKDVYLKANPLPDCQATVNSIVQTLPSSDDGFIYIYLGHSVNTTEIELSFNHPVYKFVDGTVQLYTNSILYYLGAGSIYSNVVSNDTLYSEKKYISITCSDNYLFLVTPHIRDVYMSGFLVPMSVQETITIDNKSYYVIKSSNKYTGTFKIKVE